MGSTPEGCTGRFSQDLDVLRDVSECGGFESK